ncbi:hypothetical protein [Undibacterium luofuense]|uniref:hypothetical protein n=1 Tax=Undibacterium luofuense TaxID=2828733 RepID=UPI0030EB7D35
MIASGMYLNGMNGKANSPARNNQRGLRQELAARINAFVFDKTGTLTTGKLLLLNDEVLVCLRVL